MLKKMLDQNGVERLEEAVCVLLRDVGFYCESEEMLSAYASAGASVDHEKMTAKFPIKVIKDFAENLRIEDKSSWDSFITGHDKINFYSGYIPYTENEYFQAPPEPYMFHNLSTYYYDDEKREKRIGNVNDFISLIKLGDHLHRDKGMGHALNLTGGVDSRIEPLVAARTLAEYAYKPSGVYVHEVSQIPFIEEIEEIIGENDMRFHWMANAPCSSPLKMEKAVCDRYVYMVKSGKYPAKLTAMPVSGVNIPVTATGGIVVVAAEFIVLWLAARLLQDKKIPLTALPMSGAMDMSGGGVSFTAFDVLTLRIGICDFMEQWTGIKLSPGPGEISPTKLPGLAAAIEKAYCAMTIAAFTGTHPDIGVGHIDSGVSVSEVQLLFDIEATNSLKFLEKIRVDSGTIGLETMLELGHAVNDNFLGTYHTVDFMKEHTCSPRYMSKDGYSPELEQAAREKALSDIKQIRSMYQKPEGREDKLACIDAVIQKALKYYNR